MPAGAVSASKLVHRTAPAMADGWTPCNTWTGLLPRHYAPWPGILQWRCGAEHAKPHGLGFKAGPDRRLEPAKPLPKPGRGKSVSRRDRRKQVGAPGKPGRLSCPRVAWGTSAPMPARRSCFHQAGRSRNRLVSSGSVARFQPGSGYRQIEPSAGRNSWAPFGARADCRYGRRLHNSDLITPRPLERVASAVPRTTRFRG